MPKEWGTVTSECISNPNLPANLKCIEAVVANLISMFVALAGITLLVMFIIGSFIYLTAGSDAKKTQKAQQTMLYAVIGVVVMILCYIALVAIEWFTGVNLTTFEIPMYAAPTP